MQNLNLYQHQRRRQAGPRPRHMLQALLVAFGLALLHGGWQLWQVRDLQAQLQQAEALAQSEEQLLAGEQAVFREPQLDPQLPLQVASAQERNRQLQRLADYLRLLAQQHQQGFADPLVALSEQHPAQGLWLTRIAFTDGGRHLRLEGRSSDQQALPSYLQALGQAPAFRGRQFAHFSAKRTAAEPFDFVLSSQAADQEKQP